MHRPLLFLLLLPSVAPALVIDGYDPALHNRFTSGFESSSGAVPVANISPGFVADGHDLSGVGWHPGSGTPGGDRVRNVTLVTPLHIMHAAHNSADEFTAYRFLAADGRLLSPHAPIKSPVASGTYGNDLIVATLAGPFASTQRVTPFRVLDVRAGSLSSDLGGIPLLIYGSQADGVGPRLAPATALNPQYISLASTQSWTGNGVSGAASYWESGDSGSPAFVRYATPDGTVTLTYAGPAYFPTGFSTVLPQSRFAWSVTPGINTLTKADGYALKRVIYDNPADTVRTAPQWTGLTGADLTDAANWDQAISPSGHAVIFDASVAGCSTTVVVDQDLSLRGALFKNSLAPCGFTFNGAGALLLGGTGLRNETSATQTFNLPLALADSQNWEAAAGDLVFNGPIDTTAAAHLVVIGGAQNTALNAPVSGAGSLAKDDDGILTLNAANTYVGKTWIHAGALRLGPAGSLPATTEVVFATTNPATLDLNGRDQTLAALRTPYGGVGHVELGAGTLTVNNTSTAIARVSIVGSGGFTKNNNTLFSLEGANTYFGPTTINNGVLRVVPGSLPPSSNIVLTGGGVLELASGMPDFTAALGIAPGQVRFAGSGGFSATGGDRFVNLGGTAPPLALVWGQTPHFVPDGGFLIFSSSFADSTIDFRNPLVLATSGSGTRSLLATGGAAAVDARISGDISSPGATFGINKYNSGTLELTGHNTYSGPTAIYGGVLRLGSPAALPTTSNVVLAGGILELAVADLSSTLGTADGQLRFTASGGFSAAGADRTVNLGGSPTPQALAWGQTHFLQDGQTLFLSSSGADARLDLLNPIDLGSTGSGTRAIQVNDGAATLDARLRGAVTQSGGAFGLTKTGAGTLDLASANAYAGPTTLAAGALRASTANAIPASSNLVLAGGVLELAHGDLSASLGAGSGQVRFTAGSGFAAVGATRVVNLGGLATPQTLAWGASDFVPHNHNLTLSSTGADGTLVFRNPIVLGSTGDTLRGLVVPDGSAALDARLTGNLTQTGGTLGIKKMDTGVLELSGVNSYSGQTRLDGGALRVLSAAALPSTSNIVLNGGVLELGHANYAATIGTGGGQIRFNTGGGFSASGADRAVTLNGGASLVWGAGSQTVIAGEFPLVLSSTGADATIDFTNPLRLSGTGPAQRVIRVADGSAAIDARLSGVIWDISGTYGLTKTGAGTLELTAVNTYRGPTRVEAGSLLVHGNQSTATGECRVSPGATLGGVGRLGGNLSLASGSRLTLSTRAGVTGGLHVTGVVAIEGVVTVTADDTVFPGAYTLLSHDGPLSGAHHLLWSPPAGSDLVATFDHSDPRRIQIIITSPSPFALWRSGHFGDSTDPDFVGDAADPDTDGLANLLEYALGGDPLEAGGQPAPTVSLADDRLRLTFNRIADPALRYEVEAANALAASSDWFAIWTSTGAQNTAGPVSVDDPEPFTAHPRRFLRLRVSLP